MIIFGEITIQEASLDWTTMTSLVSEAQVIYYEATMFGSNKRRNFNLTMTTKGATPEEALDKMHTALREKNVVLLPIGEEPNDAHSPDTVE